MNLIWLLIRLLYLYSLYRNFINLKIRNIIYFINKLDKVKLVSIESAKVLSKDVIK